MCTEDVVPVLRGRCDVTEWLHHRQVSRALTHGRRNVAAVVEMTGL
jgi:hypothetical protein